MKSLIGLCFTLCLSLVLASLESNSEVNGASIAEYLPPPVEEVPDAPETKLAEDGYRYKTVRRLRYRHRREISQEYLPPQADPSQVYLSPDNNIDTKIADDGYRYKTIRRLRFRNRQRRDVSETITPSNDYLPPVNDEPAAAAAVTVAAEAEAEAEAKSAEPSAVLADDGYHYKTIRRLKFRRHRRDADVAMTAENAGTDAEPSNDYLPPAVTDAPVPETTITPIDDNKTEVKSAELAKDGYRYKTVRRIRYRYRHK